MSDALDEWTITDASQEWDFRIVINKDDWAGRPEKHGDIYSVAAMNDAHDKDPESTEEDRKAAVLWARQAVRAWERDLWTFAAITVHPVHKKYGDIVPVASASMGACDYGLLPNGDGTNVDTSARDYVMSAWGDDLVAEATGLANEALTELRERHAARVEEAAQKIVDHTGGQMANARAAALAIVGSGL